MAIHDLLVVPRAALNSFPLFLSEQNEHMLAPCVAPDMQLAIAKLLGFADKRVSG